MKQQWNDFVYFWFQTNRHVVSWRSVRGYVYITWLLLKTHTALIHFPATVVQLHCK